MSSEPKPAFRDQAAGKQKSAGAQFLHFLLHNKKWWLTPIILLLVLLGVLIILGGSGVAPFIYSLF
jgi:Family of unknown function (DUF5989)